MAPSLVPVARERATDPTIAIVDDRILLAWKPRSEAGLRWANFDIHGTDRQIGDLALGDAVSPKLAARGSGVLIAYAKRERERGRSTLFVGSGATPAEAAARATALTTAAEIRQIRIANGEVPWLAWVEPAAAEPIAHVASLDCP